MKKIMYILMIAIMVLGLVACKSGSGDSGAVTTTEATNVATETTVVEATEAVKEQSQASPEDFDTFKIAVCEAQANDETVTRRNYLENYIAPKYNVEFIFSEQLKNDEAQQTFIENAIDAGAQGIMDFRIESAEQFIQLAAEHDIWYAVDSARTPKIEALYEFDNFAGAYGASTSSVADVFYNWINENASDDGSEGFIISSAIAFKGNIQHEEVTAAMLRALQERYDLTYEDEIDDIVHLEAPSEIANDKGIRIYVYPGSAMLSDAWLPGIASALQTGSYGTVLMAGQYYTSTAVVVDEVERSFDMDVKVVSVASISDSLTNAFNTQDTFGNPSLDAATVKSNSLFSAAGFVLLYNALTDYNSVNTMSDGEQLTLQGSFWGVDSAEQVNTLSEWDTFEGGKWIVDYDVIDSMLGIYHPDYTGENLQEVLNGVTYENAVKRLNE